MNKVHAMYPVLKKAGEKLWQPLDCYYRVALAQMKVTHRLSDDEIRSIITRESKDRDAAAFLRTAVKALEKACQLDDNDNSRNALEATQRALAFIEAAEQAAIDMAKYAELQAKYGLAA
jgi:ribosomal protein S20